MKPIKDQADMDAVLKDGGLVLAKFTADWCPPCRAMVPTLTQAEGEFQEVLFVEVDIESLPDVAEKYRVTSLPTLLLFRDANEADRLVGSQPIGKIRALLGRRP